MAKCNRCDGKGTIDCPACKGKGRKMGVVRGDHECGHCGGSGEKSCPACNGKGIAT